METVFVSLVTVALIIVSTLTMVTSYFHAASALTESWRLAAKRAGEIRNTHITAISGNYTGGNAVLNIQNCGAVALADFPHWDVIATYEDGSTEYMVYDATYPPGSGAWAVEGIYLPQGSPEKFDLGILNPGEEMRLELGLSQGLSENETVRLTVATPNGVTAQCLITMTSPGG